MTSSSVDLVIGKLISLLENEASSLLRVPDEIREMKRLLESMRSFLVDADDAGAKSASLENWVKNVRELAYEVEDIIDEFTYHENRRRQWQGNNCKNFIQQILHFPKDWRVSHEISAKLQDINKRMKNITERAQQFGVQQLEGRGTTSPYYPQWKKRHSESSLFFNDDELVGIKKAQHELLGRLMVEEPRRTVISVIGMGGSGKTTLVANTFKKQSVKNHFKFCTWITVSQQYSTEELLRSMVKDVYKQMTREVPTEVDTMTYKALMETLVQFLESRRYLVVLDDVWSIHLWRDLSIAFPEGMHGSRVIVTTRREDAVPSQSGFVSSVYRIPPLIMHDAWDLFCKKAFPNEQGGCPSHLDSLAKTLVEKCEGLPLAIATLGGLMSSKKSITEWKRVHDNLAWELNKNPSLEIIKSVSLLSFHDLPFQLKHCFLYCSIFPEDYEIGRKRIIRLWMAEGFLENADHVLPEVVAESYLMELINRSLLQVTQRNDFGRPKRFKMHDILRDIALSVSKEESFLAACDGGKGVEEKGIHRCSIQVKDKEIKTGNDTSQLRSLIIFIVGQISKLNEFPSGFKLLRVLDLENAPIDEIPGEFGHLFNLRYLNLSRTQVKLLPKSIGKLFNLQSLILKYTMIRKLPNEIAMLQNLRHLSAFCLVKSELNPLFRTVESIDVPPNICMIKSLQVLSYVRVTDALLLKLKDMEQLTRIALGGLTESHEDHLCYSLQRMNHLHCLLLGSAPLSTLKLDALLSAPPYLERLNLIGKLAKVPRWFNTLLNLKILTLQKSELGEDAVSHIQALPNLLQLGFLKNSFVGERLCFVEGFKKLQCLCLDELPRLKEIVIESGVMLELKELAVFTCKEFRQLPFGWKHLSHLEEVRLLEVSSELVESICGKGNDNLPTTSYILLTKSEDEETESRWIHQILNW